MGWRQTCRPIRYATVKRLFRSLKYALYIFVLGETSSEADEETVSSVAEYASDTSAAVAEAAAAAEEEEEEPDEEEDDVVDDGEATADEDEKVEQHI